MLKIKLELHPYGDESLKRELGELDIWNDSTGSAYEGNYGYRLNEKESPFAPAVSKTGEVKKWKRNQPAWKLVKKCLELAFEDVNNELERRTK